MEYIIGIGVFILCILVVFYLMVKNAPEGYEDKDGFHYGKEDKWRNDE